MQQKMHEDIFHAHQFGCPDGEFIVLSVVFSLPKYRVIIVMAKVDPVEFIFLHLFLTRKPTISDNSHRYTLSICSNCPNLNKIFHVKKFDILYLPTTKAIIYDVFVLVFHEPLILFWILYFFWFIWYFLRFY